MRTVKSYYQSTESRLGYKALLKGIRHFGYYPENVRTSHSIAQINMMHIIAEGLSLRPGSKVLDVGCGEGATALYLAEQHKLEVSGVDLLKESIQIANSRARDNNINAKFSIGDFNSLPFDDNTFDGLYALESFIHAHDPQGALGEFRRVLKSGGHLVIGDYTMTRLENMPSRYRKVTRWVVNGASAPGLLIIDHGFYERILPKVGYTKVAVHNITPNIMPMLVWFKKLSYAPYQLVRILNLQTRWVNTTMGYFGKGIAEKGWWQFVIVQARKK